MLGIIMSIGGFVFILVGCASSGGTLSSPIWYIFGVPLLIIGPIVLGVSLYTMRKYYK